MSGAGGEQAGEGGTRTVTVRSPRGGVRATVRVDGDGGASWAISVDGRQVMAPSPLGLLLSDGVDLTAGLRIVDFGRPVAFRDSYTLRQGKVSHVSVLAARQTVTVRAGCGVTMAIDVWVCAYGAAIRYRVDLGPTPVAVLEEVTSFSFLAPGDGGSQFTLPYTQGSPKYQEFYIHRAGHHTALLGEVVLSEMNPTAGASFPLLARVADQHGDDWWILASESGLDGNYAACHLNQPVKDDACRGTISFSIAFPTDDEACGTYGTGAPQLAGRTSTPWRYVAVGRTVAEVAQTTLTTDLAEPNKIGDDSWVTPGAGSWSWLTEHASPLSLEGILPFFELAKDMGWPYSLVDARWDQMTDSTGTPVSLERLVAEADRRAVKLFLWYNSAGTNNDATANTPRDRLVDPVTRRKELKYLADLGIAGIKVDGWQSDKQHLMALQRDVVADAALVKLHVLLHNTTIPRGWERTYPNLLGVKAGITSEGYRSVSANNDRMPEQATIAAVSRNAIGTFDYGPVLLRPRLSPGVDRLTTVAHELALALVYQSGFHGYADSRDQYMSLPEAARAMLSELPLAWDETRFLEAQPGRDVIVARRRRHTWWVAGINGLTTSISPVADPSRPGRNAATGAPLALDVDLQPLGISRRARTTMFTDVSASDPTLTQRTVTGNRLHIQTAPFGGFLGLVSG